MKEKGIYLCRSSSAGGNSGKGNRGEDAIALRHRHLVITFRICQAKLQMRSHFYLGQPQLLVHQFWLPLSGESVLKVLNYSLEGIAMYQEAARFNGFLSTTVADFV
ncbi:hypothetical protein [Nostoc sp. WHI]|uniref:hypothetical protein n=1 Tax=Nostoc sp. WHI TaxID=2650611 RepID=UPI0018C789CA|nr:hypothetical protein [Nostoc sp. WHI]MBG1265774.1 hypothetical protein [Nostoc sp. WHI]